MLSPSIYNILVAFALGGRVAADVHLMYSDGANVPTTYFTCPSNYFSDKCWCSGDRRSSSGFPATASNGEYKLRLDDVCGVAAMDFWWRPIGVDGDSRIQWEGYIPNADGSRLATCYTQGGGAAGSDCLFGLPVQFTPHDGWVCYSEICGHA